MELLEEKDISKITDTDILEYLKDSKMVTLRVSYFAGGIINMYEAWFDGKLECSLNDIALEVSRILSMTGQG